MINLATLYFFFIILCGFSFLFKYFFFKCKKITNLDLIYGFYFILLLAIFFNFFFPLKFLLYPLIFIGTVSFIFNINYFKLKFSYYIFIILGIFFISLSNGIAVDSLVYHLQIIQKFNVNPIVLGFFNLDHRYGFNNPWHLIMSIFYFESDKINFIYYFNLIIFSILIYESLRLKNKKDYSHIFLILSVFFLFFYSIAHPSGNGIILTLLGSTDSDFPAAIFCIFSVYIFLSNKKFCFIKLPFFVLLSFFCKLSYAALFIFLVNPIFFSKKFLIFIIFPLIGFFIRNLFISGCIIYPLPSTCFNFSWSNIDLVILSNKILTSFARDVGPRLNYLNFDYTLNSFAWFNSWFMNYFIKNSLIQITALSLLIASITYLINFRINSKHSNKNIMIIYFFLLSLILWTRALDTRYIIGILVSINAYFITYFYFSNSLWNKINLNYKIIFIFFFLILVLKNHKNVNYFNKSIKKEEFSDYKYELKDSANLIYIPKNNNRCADTSLWCMYDEKRISINKKFYLTQINEVDG
jgi:hypothetical protein